MGRWGRVDFRQLQQLEQQIEQLERADFDKFCQETAKELAARLLGKVIKRTPVGDYPKASGKMGGTLRRGWTADSDRSAVYSALFKGTEVNVKEYVDSLQVEKHGNEYVITITNPVEYASYVEYGHRTVNGKSWAPGHFMLTTSEQEIRDIAPGVLQAKIKKFLQECLK